MNLRLLFTLAALLTPLAFSQIPEDLFGPRPRIEEMHALAPTDTHFVISFRSSAPLSVADQRTRIVTYISRVPALTLRWRSEAGKQVAIPLEVRLRRAIRPSPMPLYDVSLRPAKLIGEIELDDSPRIKILRSAVREAESAQLIANETVAVSLQP